MKKILVVDWCTSQRRFVAREIIPCERDCPWRHPHIWWGE